ncbi:MAG: hypothetical protein K2X90_04235 [Candidatus Babeliaceae bacterium]|nr:hypothetical protein [Candidatus Babeliaceae bacterium]
MFNLSQHSAAIAKGIFYILVGVILCLSALNILSGSLMNYLIGAVAAYFVTYGLFLSGIYDKALHLLNAKK